jgi:hypothetical protein
MQKIKKVQGKLNSELDLNGVTLSKIVHIHEALSESLKMLVGEMENENVTLKETIRECFDAPTYMCQPNCYNAALEEFR